MHGEWLEIVFQAVCAIHRTIFKQHLRRLESFNINGGLNWLRGGIAGQQNLRAVVVFQ